MRGTHPGSFNLLFFLRSRLCMLIIIRGWNHHVKELVPLYHVGLTLATDCYMNWHSLTDSDCFTSCKSMVRHGQSWSYMVWLQHIRQVDGLTAAHSASRLSELVWLAVFSHSASRWSDCTTFGKSMVWLHHIRQVDDLTAPHSAILQYVRDVKLIALRYGYGWLYTRLEGCGR